MVKFYFPFMSEKLDKELTPWRDASDIPGKRNSIFPQAVNTGEMYVYLPENECFSE